MIRSRPLLWLVRCRCYDPASFDVTDTAKLRRPAASPTSSLPQVTSTVRTLRSRHRMRGSFVENVLILLTGTAAAQIIPFALAPILTRLYTAQEFGVLAFYVAVVSIVGVVGTGRYELAILLPERDDEAVNVAAVVIALSAALSAVLGLAWLAGRPFLRSFARGAVLGGALALVPVALLVTGLYQALSAWTNRRKAYRRLAAAEIAMRAAAEGGKWALAAPALRGTLGNGLVAGTLGGQAVATVALGWQVWRDDREHATSIRLGAMRSALRKYAKFPACTVPYSLIATLGNDFIVFAFTAFNLLQPAGYFGFTRRIITGPIGLISGSVGRVFFQETAVSIGTERFERLTIGLMERIARISTVPCVFFAFWAPDIFAHVFGGEWREAGRYAALLTPASFFLLFTSWPERVYEVTQKQHVSLLIQLGFDVVRIGAVWALLSIGAAPWVCVATYSVVSCLFNATYLWGIFVVAGLPTGALIAIARRVAMTAGGMALLFYVVGVVLQAPVAAFGVDLVLVLVTGWMASSKILLRPTGVRG